MSTRRQQEQDFAGFATLEKLLDVGQSLIVVRDLGSLLQKIAESAGGVLGADVIVLYEYEEKMNDVTVPPVIWGDIRHPDVLKERNRVRPHRESAVFKMLERAEPFYAPDARKDWAHLIEDWPQEEDSEWFVHREGIVSSAAVGLTADGGKLGVLFANYRKHHGFGDEERKTVELFANQAAIAIQNAHLLADLERQVEGHCTLNSVGTELAGILDEEAILNHVARAAANTLDCTHCSVFCLEAGELVVRAAQGSRARSLRPGRTFRLGQGVAGWVAQTGQSALVANTLQDDRFDPGWSEQDPQSLVVVPMYLDQKVYGAISAEQDRMAAFDEHDQRLLETLALQTGQAVQNARLQTNFESQIERLETLNHVSRELGTKLDSKSIFEAVVEAVLWTLDCTHCTIFALENNVLIPHASRGRNGKTKITRRFALGEGLAGWAAQEGKSILARDAKVHERFSKGKTHPDVERSMIVVPVRVGGQVAGIISVDQDRVQMFDEQDLHMVEALALQAGTAVQNASLLGLLREVSATISTTSDVEDTLARIIEGAMRLTGTDSGVVHLVDQTKQTITRSFEVPEGFGHLCPRFSQKTGMTWAAISTGETIAVSDITKDDCVNPAMVEKGVRAIIGTPMKVEDKTIGVLFLNDFEIHEFTAYEKELLSTLASHAAIAIRNANLFAQEQQHAATMRLLQQISANIGATLELEETLDLIIKGAMRLTGTSSGVIHLIDEAGQDVIQSYEVPENFGHPPSRFSHEQGLTWEIFSTGQPIEVSDVTKDKRIHPDMFDKDVMAIIGTPLETEGKVIGALYLNDSIPHTFTEYEKEMLATLASNAAIAIQNAHLFAKEQKQANDLSILQNVSAKISAVMDIEDTLPFIVKGAMQLTNLDAEIDGGVIHLIDQARGTISHSYEFPVGFGHLPSRFAERKGLTWEIFSTGQIIEIHDVPRSERVSPRLAWSGIQSLVGIPLKLGNSVLGALFLNSSRQRSFAADEKALLTMLTEQAALAIDKARRYGQRVEDISALEEINEAILERELDEVTQLIAGKAMALTGANYATLRMVDEPGEFLVLKAVEGRDSLEDTLPIDEHSFTGWAAMTGEAALCPDVKKDPHYLEWYPDVESCMAAPLKRDDQVIGTLYVESTQANAFSERHQLDLLRALANQAAIAIENARMYGQRAQDIAALQEINEAVISEDLDAVLRLVVKEAVKVTPGEYGELWLREPDTSDLVLANAWGPAEAAAEQIGRLMAGVASINRRVARTGQPYICDNVNEEEGFYRIYEEAQSSVTVPLKYHDEVIGTLNVESPQLKAFTKEHSQLLDSFSDQAAIAIMNARLYEQRARDLAALQEINQAITTAPWEKIAELVAEQAKELTQAEYSGLWVMDGDRLVLGAMYGREPKEGEEPPPQELPIDEHSVNGWVAMTGKPYNCSDASEDPHYLMWREDIQSSMAVPLQVGGRLIGTLGAESARPDAFSRYQLELLQSLADQAAIAIENARLYRELKVLTEIGQTVSTRKIDEILDLVYKQTSEVMNLGDALFYIAFFDDTRDGVSFGLTIERDNKEEIDKIRWGMRHGEEVEEWMPRARRDPPGLTEYVIRTMQPVLIVQDFDRQAEERGIRVWPKIGKLKRSTQSWLGVPMIAGDQIIGMISIQSLEREHAFDEAHREVLATVANQAAVAIENARLHATLTQKVEELEQANIELQAARKQAVRATLSAMAGGYVHRLNGALGFIPSSVDTIMGEVSTDVQEVLRDVRGGVAEAIAYTKRMTDLFTGQDLPRESVDINLMLQAVVHKLHIPPSINVVLELESDLPEIMADKMFLTEVFYNIIVNALEAMAGKPKGDLRVGSRLAEFNTVETWISDTGCGILEENLPRLFEPDFTTKPGKRGIGLWFCDTVIKVLGGAINVDSTPNVGTTFTLILPQGD